MRAREDEGGRYLRGRRRPSASSLLRALAAARPVDRSSTEPEETTPTQSRPRRAFTSHGRCLSPRRLLLRGHRENPVLSGLQLETPAAKLRAAPDSYRVQSTQRALVPKGGRGSSVIIIISEPHHDHREKGL
ncbi:hypothetical protein HPB50_000497 [Hyalomma asiaticum]|uniref:Uncharacterized protein n=1 Tax=Hyalomma asiaticum TaxID=266040 RepID=A0ACB7RLT9_HYAAI|nr:hypothetical protein HPB50_000497 [Hyalomma asiaticum]